MEGKICMSTILNNFLETNLNELRDQGLYNEIDPVESANGPVIQVRGKQLINLSSNSLILL